MEFNIPVFCRNKKIIPDLLSDKPPPGTVITIFIWTKQSEEDCTVCRGSNLVLTHYGHIMDTLWIVKQTYSVFIAITFFELVNNSCTI